MIFDIFQSKTRSQNRPPSVSERRRTSPLNKNRQRDDDDDDDIDPDQFAKILELLANPKLKSILKPEIADALEDNLEVLGQNTAADESPEEIPKTRVRVARPRPASSGAPLRTISGRKIPERRRNPFTSKFIPKVRPVGQLDNLSENAFIAADSLDEFEVLHHD